jgi:hypothetical protein
MPAQGDSMVADARIEQLIAQNEQLIAQNEQLIAQNEQLMARIATLEQQLVDTRVEYEKKLAAAQLAWSAEREALLVKIAWLTQLQFGKTSEKSRRPTDSPAAAPAAPAAAQPATFLGSPVDAGATQEEAEANRDARETPQETRERRKQAKDAKKGLGANGVKKPVNGGGRRPVNADLPVFKDDLIVVVPEAQRILADGTRLVFLGYEEKDEEYYVQAMIMRLKIKREILGMPDTGEEVVRAPIPPSIVPRSKYHDTVIIESMVRKFWTGTPFGKVVQDMQALGSDLSAAQVSDHMLRFSRFLCPLTQAIRGQVLNERVVCMDETTFPTQDGSGYLWAFLAGGQVFFHYGRRTSEELRNALGLPQVDTANAGQPGDMATTSPKRPFAFLYSMTDAFPGYHKPLKEAGIQEGNCWSHGRRNFKPYEKEPVIAEILQEIGILYRIEKDARKEVARLQLKGPAAHAIYSRLRAEQSKPQLDKLHSRLSALSPRYPEGTGQRQAFDYLLTRWECFTLYSKSGEIPIDNNDCERAQRAVVIGRKNWLLVGSDDAAQPAADLYTVMESCRLNHVDPRRYLPFVVDGIHKGRTDFDAMTPRAVAAQFSLRKWRGYTQEQT